MSWPTFSTNNTFDENKKCHVMMTSLTTIQNFNKINRRNARRKKNYGKISILSTVFEPQHEISNNVVFAASKASDQPAHTCILIRAFACHMNIL